MPELTIVPITTNASIPINHRFLNELGETLKEVFWFDKYTILNKTKIADVENSEELLFNPTETALYKKLVDVFFKRKGFIGDRILGISIDPELYRLFSDGKAEVEEWIGFKLPNIADIPLPYFKIKTPLPGSHCWFPIAGVIAQDRENARDIYAIAVHTLNHTFHCVCTDPTCAGTCLTFMINDIRTLCTTCRLNTELYQEKIGNLKIPDTFLDDLIKYDAVWYPDHHRR